MLFMSTLAVYGMESNISARRLREWPVLDASIVASVDLSVTKTHNAA